MKKSSNKIFAAIACIMFFVQTICLGQPQKQRTDKELEGIANQYGMGDMMPLLKNSNLLYADKAYVENYFKKESEARQKTKQFNTFLAKTTNVRTYAGFFKLLDASPSMKEEFLSAHGWNEDAYQKYVKECLKYKWRIYRDEFGGLSFYRADTKIGKGEQGQRIDSLPLPKE